MFSDLARRLGVSVEIPSAQNRPLPRETCLCHRRGAAKRMGFGIVVLLIVLARWGSLDPRNGTICVAAETIQLGKQIRIGQHLGA